MNRKPFPQTTFITSAAKLSQTPQDEGYEVAFVGRSNAGKSSALNAITGDKKLARISKTPGCTQLLNFFGIDAERRLVDLPGYGYAKVPEEVKLRWQKTLSKYLEERACLRGLILVSDIRHPLKAFDQQMLTWCSTRELPIHVLLTKADKLSRSAATLTLKSATKTLKDYPGTITCQLFSSPSKTGVEEIRKKLFDWLEM